MHPGGREQGGSAPVERPLATIMIQTTEGLIRALPVDLVYMCLPDPESHSASLHPLYEGQERFRMSAPSRFTLAGSLLEEILAGGGPRILERPFEGSFSALEMSLSRDIGSAMLVPLEGSAGPLGTLILGSFARSCFGEEDLDAIGPLVAPLARAIEKELSAVS
jgi:hypothetical protein